MTGPLRLVLRAARALAALVLDLAAGSRAGEPRECDDDELARWDDVLRD